MASRIGIAIVVGVLLIGCKGATGQEGAPVRAAVVARPGGGAQPSAVRVIDMIPSALSIESNQDSEPFLAIHQAHVDWMVASAFTRDPAGPNSPTAPIFVSRDGGHTWMLNSIVPSQSSTHDITHAFDGKSLYTGILRASDDDLLELTTDDFTSADVMTTRSSRPDDDQPFVRAATANGKTFVYIGNNDTSLSLRGGSTATVDVSIDGGATFTPVRLESRQSADISSCTGRSARQDGPSVRPSAGRDGVVYVAYFGWRSFNGDCTDAEVTSDVVVVRDDAGGGGPNAFQALVDPVDHKTGVRVVSGITIPWKNEETLAHERIGSTLALAVDPADSRRVFVTWADRAGADDVYTIHVRASTDKGLTWPASDLLVRHGATNAALAVADNGTVALAYQQLVTGSGGRRWQTHVVQTRDDFRTSDDIVLADTSAEEPQRQFLPYLGDYLGLLAVNGEFRGVFSASNYPDQTNFPHGVVYQRRVEFGQHRLLDSRGREVPISIDPFYFSLPVKQ